MKRGASEYITKENGSTSNNEAAEDKPKMSTAAQQARRKMATPKSRLGRSTTPTGGSSSFGQSQTSAFSFGTNATQSFPAPSPASAQTQSFNFAVPGAASSFTFGQQNGMSQPVSNPFANMNGASATAENQPDNAMMEDTSPKHQKTTNNLFNFGSTQPVTTTNGISFDDNNNSAAFSNPFGRQKPQELNGNATTGLFGSQSQSPQPQTNGFNFGQSTQTQTSAPTPPSLFGQSSTSSPPTFSGFGNTATNSINPPAPAPLFSFGKTSVVDTKSASPQPEGSTISQSKPLFGFGQTSAFGKPASDTTPASEPTKPAFTGFEQPAITSTESPSSTTPSKPLFSFGQPASTAAPEPQSAPPKSLFNFGQTAAASSTQPSTTSLFGNLSRSAETTQSSNSLFSRTSPATGTPPDESEDTIKPANAFAGLFAQKPSSTADDTPKPAPFKFGGTPSLEPSTKSTEPPTTSNDPFTFKPSTPPAQTETTDQPKSAFQFPQSNASSGGLFSPKENAAPPSTSLFNLNKPTPSAGSDNDLPSSITTASNFGASFAGFNSNAGSTPFKMTQPSTERHVASDDEPPTKKRLFQSSTAQDSMAHSALGAPLNKTSGPAEPVQPRLPSAHESTTTQQPLTRAVSTEGPPQIPRFLSADKYKSYDENWRLKALNRKFKTFVNEIDPGVHDFLGLVQNYLDHREAIGEGLNQYIRKQAAGSKRKAIDVDDMQGDDSQSKKSKPTETTFATSATQPDPAVNASSIFRNVPSPKPVTASPAKSAESNTSNLFRSMIPGAATSTSTQPSADYSKAPTFGFKPTKSTTPPSSPPKSVAPKSSGFQIPSFGGGATDFANAFAKSAESNKKKFENEAKEKRKAEEFDSDEDDEETWNKKYEEEQRAKRAKVEAAKKGGFVPSFGGSASSSRSNSPFNFAAPVQSVPATTNSLYVSKEAVMSIESDGEVMSGNNESTQSGNDSGNSGDDEDEEQAEDDLPEDQAEEEDEEEGEPIPTLPPGKSLFDRIEKAAPTTQEKGDEPILQSAAKSYYKPAVMFGNIGKESPEQPTASLFTPANSIKGEFTPSAFNFTATAAAPTFGSSLKEGPIPGEGLFGSRPSTPQPAAEQPKALFGSFTSSALGDNTWKAGSPIKFGSSTTAGDSAAPSIEVSAATPPAKDQQKPAFGGSAPSGAFFGAASSNGGSLGFSFGTPSNSTTSTQPAPGFLGAANHLNTGVISRGSSPGIVSDAESVATDVSTAADAEHSDQPQTNLMGIVAAGEENDEVIHEIKGVLFRLYKDSDLPEKTKLSAGWNRMGVGNSRVLRDKTTGKCRIVFRTEPGAHVALNTRIIPGGKYTAEKSGSNAAVKFPVAVESGVQMWMVKVKTLQAAEELAALLERNKTK